MIANQSHKAAPTRSHYHTLHKHLVRRAPHGDVQMMVFWSDSMYRVMKIIRLYHAGSHRPLHVCTMMFQHQLLSM